MSHPYRNPTEAAVNMDDQHSSHSNQNRSIFIRIMDVIQQSWESNGRLKFMLIALGIFVSFICHGMFMERIMRGCYGDEGNKNCPDEKKFTYPIALVAIQMLCAFTAVRVLTILKPEKKDPTHILYYTFASISNIAAMVSSSWALKFVAYPMQVIAKSSKPISVMMVGLFICKRYTIQRYFFVLLIVIGVVMFKLFESKEGKRVKVNDDSAWFDAANKEQIIGMALLVLSLFMDGVLGAIQDRMRALYSPTSRQMMLSMSFFGFVFSTFLALGKGELVAVYEFAQQHPNVIWHLFTLGIAAACGQFFIFAMVSSFGSLACSVTTTVRKFFSVVFSIIFFGNPSTLLQWISAIIVFSALLLDTFFGKGKQKPENHETEDIEIGETDQKLIATPEKTEIVSKTHGNKSDAQQIV